MLRLRPFKPQDGKYLVQWFDNEEQFMKWSAGQFSYPLTMQQIEDYCRKWEAAENGWPMAVLDETGRMAGHLLMRTADYEESSLFFRIYCPGSFCPGKRLRERDDFLSFKLCFYHFKGGHGPASGLCQ